MPCELWYGDEKVRHKPFYRKVSCNIDDVVSVLYLMD